MGTKTNETSTDEDRPSEERTNPILCVKPEIDPTLRKMLPFGLVVLLGFAGYFVFFAASLILDDWRLLTQGESATATLQRGEGDWFVVLDDRREAKLLQAVSGAEGTRVDVLCLPSSNFQRQSSGATSQEIAPMTGLACGEAGQVKSNLAIALGMVLFMVLMAGLSEWRAASAWYTDSKRLRELRHSTFRVRASAVRIETEHPKRQRRKVARPLWFRQWALFEWNGQRYEAPSELMPCESDFTVGLPEVLVHPDDPKLSMAASGAHSGSSRT